jgi:outer membrane protein assembly factor BamB
MRDRDASRAAVGVTVLLSVVVAGYVLHQWLVYDPARDLAVSLPGGDGRPATASADSAPTDLTGTFESFDGAPADLPGVWPRFRGADFDNISKARDRFADSWGAEGPEVLWSVELGEGHAAPVVLAGRVYVLDYDEEARADAIRCFSLADGMEIWRRSYTVTVKRNHGMSRTIPAVTEEHLVTVGPRCHVVCLDSRTGDFRWGISLKDIYGTTEPLWYTGQCPMIDDGRAILAPGGKDALLTAIDCATGETAWSTPNPNGWEMSHSSIMPMTFGDRKMYVYCAIGGTVGVAADGGDVGQVLWEVPWNAKVIAPSPVQLADGMVLLTAGYGKGSMMLQVREENGTFAAEVLFEKTPKEGLACEQQTPIYHGGLVHGIMPKDAGPLREQFVCYRPDGSLVWSSGQANRFGLGPFVLADGKFFVLSDDGVLTMLRVDGEAYVELDKAKVLDGQDAWGPIAIAGTRMLMRDSTRMVCIDVGAAG